MAIVQWADIGWTFPADKQSWPIGQKVKFNKTLPEKFPTAFNYDAIYEILMVTSAPDNTFSYTIAENNSEKTYFIHESFLEKVEGPTKCICDLHTVLMVTGCKCKGL